MDKLKLHTPDLVAQNVERIAELFPGCVTEAVDEQTGKVSRKIDFDQLRQELSDHVVDGPRERYHLDWPGKREALLLANAPIAKTLRPSRDRSVDFDATRNLYIEGDNLDALKLLQETYLSKVKLVYIDPPYNTGRDFIYDDDFSESTRTYLQRSNQVDEVGSRLVVNAESNGRFHSDWASMLRPRLKLAHTLLRDDGVIFVSIDDTEVANLRKLLDEVFGEHNFVAQIVWQKVYAPKNSAQWFSEDHDYIVVYARDKLMWRPERLARTEKMAARYKNPDNDARGPWKAENMSARNRYDAGVYAIRCPSGRLIEGPPRGRYWVIDEAKFQELDRDNRIWWGPDGDNTPAIKRFLSEVSSGKTPQTLWTYSEVGHTQDAKKTLLRYVPFQNTENVLNSVKPVELLRRILQLAGGQNDASIVLDFFSGSAATAHAVLEQNAEDGGNRRFILVQLPEPLPKPEPGLQSIVDIGLSRIRNVGDEIRQRSLTGHATDIGFRVLKLDTSSMKDVYYAPDASQQDDLVSLTNNLKEDRSPEDLLFQVLIDWGVDLGLPIVQRVISGKRVFFVDNDALLACFDSDIGEELVKEMARHKPLRAVFRDSSFASDSAKINVEQIFKLLSPTTEVKCL
jgi:adenine-specific DNA-methyltransferase